MDYNSEDILLEISQIHLMAQRKQNSTRADSACLAWVKKTKRQITRRFPKSIHAVTFQGFLLKVSYFIWSYSLEHAFL
ncbi:hypothetical protein MiAbW_00103 [Microcystis aeruginosa NIES-4325]|uniref:Uncharacterized protein n=1 Tax=Microcystis aeruginosa NIES-4325 TaxID=2569534 RepID=A0A5J4F387_MICAE|nr:hypothetical protein [Microcystis aeruginosa]GEA25567.1 hypothetical protein MiAbW_00103 [Microcystis aeruginosa NIES-4325]